MYQACSHSRTQLREIGWNLWIWASQAPYPPLPLPLARLPGHSAHLPPPASAIISGLVLRSVCMHVPVASIAAAILQCCPLCTASLFLSVVVVVRTCIVNA